MGILAGVAFLAITAHGLAAQELAGGEDRPFRVVKISPEACSQIATYASNGEADYKPGVAADGTPVAPADLDGGAGLAPRTLYSFPIEIEPAGANPQFSPNTSLMVADVTIDPKTGRMTIDGQDVTGADRALAEACSHQDDHPR
jgi:hypothetical protein